MSQPVPSWASPMEGEGDHEFRAFRFYRGLWAPTRCLEDVALELPGTTLEQCTAWSVAFQWSIRAAQYDAHEENRARRIREEVERTQAEIGMRRGLIGLRFLQAAQKAGERMAKDSSGITADHAIKLANAGTALVTGDGAADVPGGDLADKLEQLSTEDLEALQAILGRAGIDLGDV